MPLYFFDSSAIIKLYQPEIGSDEVERIITEPDSSSFLSRLALVEVQRAFCQRARVREISEDELDELRRGFYTDLVRRRIRVKQLKDRYYRSAIRLIRKHAPSQTTPLPLLRTLDALHLATALEIQTEQGLDYFVCADDNLCKVAQEEQLNVINPAQP